MYVFAWSPQSQYEGWTGAWRHNNQFLLFEAEWKFPRTLWCFLYMRSDLLRNYYELLTFINYSMYLIYLTNQAGNARKLFHTYMQIWEIKLSSHIFTEHRCPTQHAARLLRKIKTRHRMWVCSPFNLHLLLWVKESHGDRRGLVFPISPALIDRVLCLPRMRKPAVGLRWRKEASGSRMLEMKCFGSPCIHSWARPCMETASGFGHSAGSCISVEHSGIVEV